MVESHDGRSSQPERMSQQIITYLDLIMQDLAKLFSNFWDPEKPCSLKIQHGQRFSNFMQEVISKSEFRAQAS